MTWQQNKSFLLIERKLGSWISPNFMKLFGILSVITAYLTRFFIDFILKIKIQVFVTSLKSFAFLCIWLWTQSIGRQARISKASSPIGQLLDYGSDSIAVVFVTLTVCYAVNAPQLQILLGATSCQALALLVNWMEYNKGIFHTQIAQFGMI